MQVTVAGQRDDRWTCMIAYLLITHSQNLCPYKGTIVQQIVSPLSEDYLCETWACNYNTVDYFKINVFQKSLQPSNVIHQSDVSVCMSTFACELHLHYLLAKRAQRIS